MMLLPSAMRLPPVPGLGKKIEKPAVKKPDPVADFERGDHAPNGLVAHIAPLPYVGCPETLKMLAEFDAKLLKQMMPYPVKRESNPSFVDAWLTKDGTKSERVDPFSVFIDPRTFEPDQTVVVQRSGRSGGKTFKQLELMQEHIQKVMNDVMALSPVPPIYVPREAAEAIKAWDGKRYQKD